MLKVEKVTKYFGSVKAVDNLSFQIKKGEIAGLLGPNGAGKTTTMRMITSYYYPAKGKIYVKGKDTQKNTLETQKLIGYLPENNPLYNDMIVIDYLKMTAKLYGMSAKEIDKILQKIAKSVGIQTKFTSTIGTLSKGYKQRVGLAAAMIHNPPLLVLDEPTEGLDPLQRQEIRKLIKNLSKDKAILISTHVMQEVKAMCNKVIVIHNGKLVTEGNPDALSGKKALNLRIEGTRIEVLSSLLKKVNAKVHVKDKRAKIKEIQILSDHEVRPEISKLAAKNNWIIWEMQMQDNLEEVFERLK